jgi:hypothetical protein
MISRRRGHETLASFRVGESSHPKEDPAEFKRARDLQKLQLEPNGRIDGRRQSRRELHGRPADAPVEVRNGVLYEFFAQHDVARGRTQAN